MANNLQPKIFIKDMGHLSYGKPRPRREYDWVQQRRNTMGDKGGKKNKEKGQKQKAMKQAKDLKEKQDKQPKAQWNGNRLRGQGDRQE